MLRICWKGQFYFPAPIRCLKLKSVVRATLFWIALGLCSLDEARAQTRVWNASTSSWTTAGNWTPNIIPNSSNDAEISNGGTAQLQASGSVRDLYLGVPIAGIGNLQLSAAGVLSGRDGFIAVGQGSVASATLNGSTARWNARNFVLGDLGTATLEIRQAADVVSTGTAVFGQQSGGFGTAIVNGVGSTWANTSDISVGVASGGELNIEDGGAVTSRDLLLGTMMTGIGTVRITGSGASWAPNNTSGNGQVEIGGFGKGTLFVSGGGTITSNGESSIGRQVNGTVVSVATITGANSRWTMTLTDTLNVGYAGKGELNLLAGGVISGVNTAYVARDANSSGVITVDGTASAWQTGGLINVGYGGTGTLEVKNGGTVSGGFNIGGLAGSTGTVNVTGAGSQISGGGTVGDAGTGTLSISQDADVVSQSVSIGAQAGSTGTATIDGAGSMWQTSGITVGSAGTGTMTIKNGADVSDTGFSGGVIAGLSNSVGTVTVEGFGSTWSSSSDLSIGEAGDGTLNIKLGAAVSNAFASVGDAVGSVGRVFVEPGSTWTNANQIVVGSQGSGTVTITGGGKMFNNGTNPTFASSVGSAPGGVGTVTVNGIGSEWTSPTSGLYVGSNGGTGTLDIQNGATVSNGEAVVGRGFELGSQGTVNVDGITSGFRSTWTNTGRLDVGLVGMGNVNVTNGGVLNSASARIGGQSTGIGSVSVGNDSTWTNTGTLEISINGTGSVTVLGSGVINAPGGTTIGSKGVLAGTGTINSNVTLNNNGIVAPGAPTGTLKIGGTFFANGKVQIDIASAMSFDKVDVTGNANLFNTLEVNLMGAFVPGLSDTFEILSAASRMSTFSSVTVKRNGVDAGTFGVQYTATSVILSNFQAVAGVAGDYNGNGVVDAADYVLWRNGGPLLNEVDTPGTVNAADYDAWRARLGNTSGSGAGVTNQTGAVPEPASGWVFAILACVFSGWSRTRRMKFGA